MKSVFTEDLKEGMVVGADSYTTTGLMIVPAGIVITKPIIDHLRALGVETVWINDEVSKPDKIIETKESFADFQKDYGKAKDKLNNTFGKMLKKSADKAEIETMIEESWQMLDRDTNSYDMIGMLYSMHNYSDITYMHCMNVGLIAALIGRWLKWSEEDIKLLNTCGLFHDIGKLLIPKEILDKPGKLSDKEYEIIKTHTIKGYELIKDYGLDERIVNCVLMHHERCNGSGYPFGLKGNRLDRFTKVIAIADVYEAMTATRVYRGPVCPFDVIAQFENNGFDLYETEYLLVFLQNIVNCYLHSSVRLSNGETAEIVLINRQKGSKPVVMTTGGRPVDLLKEKNLKIDELIE